MPSNEESIQCFLKCSYKLIWGGSLIFNMQHILNKKESHIIGLVMISTMSHTQYLKPLPIIPK